MSEDQNWIARARRCTTVDERVELIEEIMSAGLWTPGVSPLPLGEAFAVGKQTLAIYVHEAQRNIRRNVPASEYADRRAGALAYLDRVKAIAIARGTRDLAIAVRAVALEGKIVGFAIERHEVTAKLADDFSNWSTDELENFADTGERPNRTTEEAPVH